MSFWTGRRVLVTGHTGFKGAWLSLWLLRLGARVTGVALEPDTVPSLFESLALSRDIDHRICDVRNAPALAAIVRETAPEVVLHLAAQSLVRRSYRSPADTWAVNVMGTVHLLDALRALDRPCSAVIITTDKVYENAGDGRAFREDDPLGGHDPYSASKAAAEIAVGSWRRSFAASGGGLRIASARAGNVIGGGDWAEERIVPDIVRALQQDKPVRVRNPRAIRPWQHVLEPLSGYLMLAEQLSSLDSRMADAFNLGPDPGSERTVADLADECLKRWPGRWEDVSDPAAPHEAARLRLDSEKARRLLGWSPRWRFERTIEETIGWYRGSAGLPPHTVRELSLRSIAAYEASPRGAARCA